MKQRLDRRRTEGLEPARRILAEARDPWRETDPGVRRGERDLEGFMEPQAPPRPTR